MGLLYLNTLYLHLERFLSMEPTMFFYSSPDWTNYTPFEFLLQLKAPTGSLNVLEGEGEVRVIQLQYATSPLTQFYINVYRYFILGQHRCSAPGASHVFLHSEEIQWNVLTLSIWRCNFHKSLCHERANKDKFNCPSCHTLRWVDGFTISNRAQINKQENIPPWNKSFFYHPRLGNLKKMKDFLSFILHLTNGLYKANPLNSLCCLHRWKLLYVFIACSLVDEPDLCLLYYAFSRVDVLNAASFAQYCTNKWNPSKTWKIKWILIRQHFQSFCAKSFPTKREKY